MSQTRNNVLSLLGGIGIGIAVAVAASKINKNVSSQVEEKQDKTIIPKVDISDASLKEMFVKAFDKIQQDIINDIPRDLPSLQTEHIKKLLPYTVLDGKMNRGLSAVQTFLILKEYRVNEEDIYKACVLGWCIEMLQAYFLIEDDIMDRSEMRRGKPCWYKREEIGMTAINDGMLIQSMIYRLIDIHFGDSSAHSHLVHAFHEVTYLTEMGQMLDLLTEQTQPNIDWSIYTLERHSKIVIYKTAFYSFYLPVILGLIQGGIYPTEHPEIFKKTREICVEMGEYFQVQDDYLDCFGTYEQIGKVGKDIEDAKCSWVVNQALLKCSDEQRKVLEENYGIDDSEAVSRVKQLFESLGIRDIYSEYERKSVESIRQKIDEIDSLPKEIFISFLKKIEGRSK